MCGRFNLRTPASELAAFFDIVFDPPLQASLAPRFNIAPSSPVLVVRAAADRNEATLVNWGLVPDWAKDPSIGNRMINARGETVAEKPSFRSAYRKLARTHHPDVNAGDLVAERRFKEINEAYEDMLGGEVARTILTPHP